MARVALAAFVVAAAIRPATAAPPEPWREPLRRALSRVLSPAEVERLLTSRYADAALTDLFAGWDGQADALAVKKTEAGVVLETRLGDRRCTTPLARPEAPLAEPVCEDVARVDGRRAATFGPDVYAPPRPPSPRRPPRPPAAPPVIADAREPVPPEAAPSLLDGSGRAHAEEPAADVLTTIRAEHAELQERVRRPGFKDPLLPADPVEAGDALTPLAWEPIVETAVEYNLKNPFDEARMRTALPMPNPELTGLGTSVEAPPILPDLRPECMDAWQRRDASADPPTLDCYRRVAYHTRLAKKDLHALLGPLAGIVSLPILDMLLEAEVKSAVSPTSHGPVWAMIWLEWVRAHPERTTAAVAGLTIEERRLLRRRAAGWWLDKAFAAWRPTITLLLERHFVGLYPEAKDVDGLPRRAFLTDTWLWANNWLAGVDGRDEPAIREAYGRLAATERKVIDTFVADRQLGARFARATEILARR